MSRRMSMVAPSSLETILFLSVSAFMPYMIHAFAPGKLVAPNTGLSQRSITKAFSGAPRPEAVFPHRIRRISVRMSQDSINDWMRKETASGNKSDTRVQDMKWSISQTTAAAILSVFLFLAPGISVEASVGQPGAPSVLDEAKSIPSGQEARMEQELAALSDDTGFNVRVLTKDPRSEGKSSREIKELWGLPDEKSLVIILQPSRGNVLSFNSGAAVAKMLPDRFFNELTGRLGNMYAVSDDGENGIVQEAVTKIDACIRKGGCFFVPGVGKDQYTATLACSSLGGIVFGFSVLTSLQFIEKKAKGSDAIFKYSIFLYLPLWGLFFIGLGINPLIQRDAEAELFVQNTAAFAATALTTIVIWPVLMKFDPPSIRM